MNIVEFIEHQSCFISYQMIKAFILPKSALSTKEPIDLPCRESF